MPGFRVRVADRAAQRNPRGQREPCVPLPYDVGMLDGSLERYSPGCTLLQFLNAR